MRRLGFVVNPIAGMGGRVGLKGTDGKVTEARERGAEPRAPERAREALESLTTHEDVELLAAGGAMGESVATAVGFECEVVTHPSEETSAEDTRDAVRAFAEAGVDLVLFVGGDGTAVDVAETLAEERPVTLVTDAAVAHVLAEHAVDSVLVGADTILADGSVVNKVGTRGIAIAAAREDVSVYAVAANDKITTGDARFEDGDPEAVYDGDAAIDVANPTFDRTPAESVTVVTEDGPLDAAAVGERAARLDALASW